MYFVEKRKRKKTNGAGGGGEGKSGGVGVGKDAKSILGRAIISIVCGASFASEALGRFGVDGKGVIDDEEKESKGKDGEWIRRATWSSLFTLEMVLSFQSIAPLPSYSPSTDGVRRVRSSPGVIGGKKGASLHHSTFVAASSLLAIGSSGSGTRLHAHLPTTGGGGNESNKGMLSKVWNDVVLRSIYDDVEMYRPTTITKESGYAIAGKGDGLSVDV